MPKTSNRIDYKKELETASKGMIMIHDPKLLIKLIVRMIVRKLAIKHAGMILYDPLKEVYVLNISRGETGVKVPAGFARFSKENSLIQLFVNPEYKFITSEKSAIVTDDIQRMLWQETLFKGSESILQFLHTVADQMRMLNAIVCVPAFYQNDLLAILLLGEKNDRTSFEQAELDFFSALASDTAMAIRNAQLFEDLKRESRKNHDLFIRTMMVLGSTIEAKDKYTRGHTERVTNISLAIARRMLANGSANFSQQFFEDLYVAGMLHDIGKIGIPEAILNKTGKLTYDEFEIMKNHTLKGVEILKPLSELTNSLDGVKYHHERYDGKGYPEGLKGEEIPMIAAIIAVADAFDAMVTDRPYRNGLSREEGIEEVKKGINQQFHPLAAQALIELYDEQLI